MKATINGIEVEGTPAEIASFMAALEPAWEDSEDRKTRPDPMQQSEATPRCFPARHPWIKTQIGGNTFAPQQHQNDQYLWNGPLPHTLYCQDANKQNAVQPAHPLNGGE